MILTWEKPKKIRSTESHNREFSSDTEIAGTYVPNMSEKDKRAWKAKHIKSVDDPRVEIRKTVVGTDPATAIRDKKRGWTGYGKVSAQLLVVVRKNGVVMSANCRMAFDFQTWDDLQTAVGEAVTVLGK